MGFGVRGGVGFWNPLLTLLVGEFVGDGFSLSWGFEVFSIDGSFCLQHHEERERETDR